MRLCTTPAASCAVCARSPSLWRSVGSQAGCPATPSAVCAKLPLRFALGWHCIGFVTFKCHAAKLQVDKLHVHHFLGVQTPLVICALCLQENLLPPPTAEVLKKKKKKFTEHSDAAEEADEFDYSVLELLFPFCVHTWHVCCVWQYLVSADIQLLSFADL